MVGTNNARSRGRQAFWRQQEERDRKLDRRSEALAAMYRREKKRNSDRTTDSAARSRSRSSRTANAPETGPACGGPTAGRGSTRLARGGLKTREGGTEAKAPRAAVRRQRRHAGQLVLSDTERQQRAADQVAVVLQTLAGSRRQLHGTLLKDAGATFRSFDRDGSGKLDYEELGEALKRLGLGLGSDQLRSLAQAMDGDRDGHIDLHEFVQHIEGASERLAKAKRVASAVETVHEMTVSSEEGTDDDDDDDDEDEQSVPRLAKLQIAKKIDVGSLSSKERMELMFRAVTEQDEHTILALLKFGVSIDVPRTNRRAGAEKETPRNIAQAQGQASRSLRAIATYSAYTRQKALCTSLVATQSLMSEMSARIHEENGNLLERVVQGASRPWRDHAALEQFGNDAHAAMQIGNTLGLVRALNKRARSFVEAHEYQNAIMDYSLVLSLCEEGARSETGDQPGTELCAHDEDDLDAMLAEAEAQEMGTNSTRKAASRMQEAWESEREEMLDATLLRRGLVYCLAEKNEHALGDMETAWARFRAKRVALGLQGVTINPTPLLDRAAQAMHVLKFKVRMKTIGSSGAKIKAVKAAKARRAVRRLKGAKFQWAELQEQHVKATSQARGVTALWLIEWATRNEIPGFGSWIVDSEKGTLLAQRLVAKGFNINGAKRAIAMVTAGRVVGVLKSSSLEALVVRANRHGRVQVVIPGGDRKFWYSAKDLQQQPLTSSDIKKKFDIVDEDQSGILDRDEVGRAVSALCGGVELDDKQLNDAMEDMDRDGSGEVCLEEFTHWFMQTKNNPESGDARFLAFTEGDRVCLKQEAVERLRAQEEVTRLESKALAWATEHQLDDDFEEPLSMPPTIAGVVDEIILPATAMDPSEALDGTPKGDDVDEGSFAKTFLRRPVLQPATHYVIYSDKTPFWDMIHGLVQHQLGLEKALEVRWFTPSQLKLELIRHGQLHAANYYYLDMFFVRHSEDKSTKIEERALKILRAVGDVMLVLDEVVPKPGRGAPPVLNSGKLLRRLCAGLEMDRKQKHGRLPSPGLQLGFSFGALERLSKQLWYSLSHAKKEKSALSVVYGATPDPVRSSAPLVRQVSASIETVVERRLEAAARAVAQEKQRELRARQVWGELDGVRHDFSSPIRTAPVMSTAGANDQVKTQQLKSATALWLIGGGTDRPGYISRPAASSGTCEASLTSEFKSVPNLAATEHSQAEQSTSDSARLSGVDSLNDAIVTPLKLSPPVLEHCDENKNKMCNNVHSGSPRGHVKTPENSPRTGGPNNKSGANNTAPLIPVPPISTSAQPLTSTGMARKTSAPQAGKVNRGVDASNASAKHAYRGRRFKVATTHSTQTTVPTAYKTSKPGFHGNPGTLAPCIARVLGREENPGVVTTNILKSSINRVAERRAFHQLGLASRPTSAPSRQQRLLHTNVEPTTSTLPVASAAASNLQEAADKKLDLRLPNTDEEVCVVGGLAAFAELCAVVEEHSALPRPRNLETQATAVAQTEEYGTEARSTGNGSRHIGVMLNSLLDQWQRFFVGSIATGALSTATTITKASSNSLVDDNMAGGVEIRRVQAALNEALSVQRPSLHEWVRTRFIFVTETSSDKKRRL